MIFKLEHHNKILTVLESFNCELLEKSSAYFGGGTLLSLIFEEYRWSKDIDFIAAVGSEGYKRLRTVIFDSGYEGLFRNLAKIQIGRGTTDQYGIRLVVLVEDTPIKTEIIAEGRFDLDPPRYLSWSSVPCLSLNDCFTSKLLSNSDRFMDNSIESRDLIDLAILRVNSPIPEISIEKAEKSYEVIRPLKKAIKLFQEKPEYREKCFSNLQISESQIPKVLDGIDLLAEDMGLSPTSRTFPEQHDILAELDALERIQKDGIN